jgi:hypothetical protein
MGSRIGIQIVQLDKSKSQDGSTDISGFRRSPILRQQWKSSIEMGVVKMWEWLSGKTPSDGSSAIRDDLGVERATVAMVNAFASKPFDELYDIGALKDDGFNFNIDINDNGLIEIDITNHAEWDVFQRDIGEMTQCGETDWGSPSPHRKLMAVMSSKGFEWKKTDEELEEIGEGGWK